MPIRHRAPKSIRKQEGIGGLGRAVRCLVMYRPRDDGLAVANAIMQMRHAWVIVATTASCKRTPRRLVCWALLCSRPSGSKGRLNHE